VFESVGTNQPSLASSLLDHPALAGNQTQRLPIPMRLWACPDLALADAADLIAATLP
jgi:iron complex transport system substrate-binding protein